MGGERFDAVTRALGSGRSRRGVLKGLGAAALGAAGLRRVSGTDAASTRANLGNSGAAHFCQSVFGANSPAAGRCTSQATQGAGAYVACGGNPANYCGGACTDVQTDISNCGRCGNVCGAPANANATCVNGTCGYVCNAGHADCRHNGLCEFDTATDVNNCGACGHVCAGGDACNAAVCAGGVCGTTPINAGGACVTRSGGAGSCQSGQCVGCTPQTCAAAGVACGSVPDGCGGELDCGTCPGGQYCNLSQCHCDFYGGCPAAGCASLTGDPTSLCQDGCCCIVNGSTSWTCVPGPSPLCCSGLCGADGRCAPQPSCTPTTCAAQGAFGASCGTFEDGCGGTLDCGTCVDPYVCCPGDYCAFFCTGGK